MTPCAIAERHLLMNDPAAGGHPLNISGRDHAPVSHAVAMFHVSLKHIGDGFDAPVRVPGKTFPVVSRIAGAEIIEEQKRIEKRKLAESESAFEFDSGTFESPVCF